MNLHGLPHMILNHARLPVPPHPLYFSIKLQYRPKSGKIFDQFFHYFRVIIPVKKHITLLEVLNATTLQMFKTFCPPTKQNCVISSNVKIGIMAYINFQCGIGHDSLIGNFVQINPSWSAWRIYSRG